MTTEEYIKKYTKCCNNELINPQHRKPFYHEWLTPENARSVAIIAKENIIEKAVEWLQTSTLDCFLSKEALADLAEDFKNAMNEVEV